MNQVSEKLLRDTWSREKQRLAMPGIYQITNKLTGEFYIGASTDIFLRWNTHLSSIRSGKHHVKRMNESFQASGLQHPLDMFEITVLERTTDLVQKESEYIEALKPPLNSNVPRKRSPNTPCTKKLILYVTPEMKQQIETKLLNSWQSIARTALEKAIRAKERKDSDKA